MPAVPLCNFSNHTHKSKLEDDALLKKDKNLAYLVNSLKKNTTSLNRISTVPRWKGNSRRVINFTGIRGIYFVLESRYSRCKSSECRTADFGVP